MTTGYIGRPREGAPQDDANGYGRSLQELATRPETETLRGLSMDMGAIMETVSNVLPDSWQAAGQGALDAVMSPAQRMAQEISPTAYAQLDTMSKATIDRFRMELGLSPINPEAPGPSSSGATTLPAPPQAQAGVPTVPTTSPGGTPRTAPPAASTTFTDRVVNPVGIGCAIVGGGATYVIAGRSEAMKRRRLARIAMSLAMGLAVGVAGGSLRHATSS